MKMLLPTPTCAWLLMWRPTNTWPFSYIDFKTDHIKFVLIYVDIQYVDIHYTWLVCESDLHDPWSAISRCLFARPKTRPAGTRFLTVHGDGPCGFAAQIRTLPKWQSKHQMGTVWLTRLCVCVLQPPKNGSSVSPLQVFDLWGILQPKVLQTPNDVHSYCSNTSSACPRIAERLTRLWVDWCFQSCKELKRETTTDHMP